MTAYFLFLIRVSVDNVINLFKPVPLNKRYLLKILLVYFQNTCHSANYRFCVCHVFLFRILFLWILCFLKLRLMQRYSRNVLSQALLLIKSNQIPKFFIFTSTSWSRYQRKKFTQGISVSLLWRFCFPIIPLFMQDHTIQQKCGLFCRNPVRVVCFRCTTRKTIYSVHKHDFE